VAGTFSIVNGKTSTFRPSAAASQVRDACVSRIIEASRRTVYEACVDAKAVASWLPPATMKAQVHAFEPRAGGAYWLSLTYLEPKDRPRGKTSAATDTFRGRFVTLVPCDGSCRSESLNRRKRGLDSFRADGHVGTQAARATSAAMPGAVVARSATARS
jgi:hypothetical protein